MFSISKINWRICLAVRTSPSLRYANFFNAHRVNVVSNQSGADKPPQNIFVDTALDASYWWDGVTERLLYFNTSKANAAVNSALVGSGIDVDMRFGVVNDPKYGGGGGSWAVYAGGNSAANEIALHEVGHSFAGLADEYFSPGTYAGPEPFEPNATKSPATGKWDRWLGYVDPDTNMGPIDYYEGARYFSNGIYRPSLNSKMRSLGRRFDAISRERFLQEIYEEVRPLDDWLDNGSLLDDPTSLWVETVDPDVLNVEWFVDGASRGLLGESILLSDLRLDIGQYEVTARAYDAILDHGFTGDSLDWWRLSDTSSLQQEIVWDIAVTVLSGDFNRDGIFDCLDVDSLVAGIAAGSQPAALDLNGDGLVDVIDLDEWLRQAGAAQLASGQPYLYGDANLDGDVDVSDFNQWNGSKFSATAAWCSGDFNADGFVDVGDFNLWNSHRFLSAAAALSVVPEPTSGALAFVVLGLLSATIRRHDDGHTHPSGLRIAGLGDCSAGSEVLRHQLLGCSRIGNNSDGSRFPSALRLKSCDISYVGCSRIGNNSDGSQCSIRTPSEVLRHQLLGCSRIGNNSDGSRFPSALRLKSCDISYLDVAGLATIRTPVCHPLSV